MYIWTGCALPAVFERDIRAVCFAAENPRLNTSGFTLPQHISLKISFDAGDRWEAVLDAIEALLRQEKQFYVNPSTVEQAGNICWIAFRENGILRQIHNRLDRQLKADFEIPQHLFDKAFRFHSTLAAGEEQAIRQLCADLQEYPLPDSLKIDTFLLGVSESGRSGTYRVVRQIKV